MVDQRIAQRRQQVRRERRQQRLHRTLLVVVALAVAVALLLVERSPLVAIEQIRVTGVSTLASHRVVAASGLEVGTSLLRIDLDEAQEAVRRMPLVEQATVVRLDPLTVEIRVRERVPKYTVQAGEDTVVIDAQGVVLGVAPRPGLQVITMAPEPLPAPGVAADPRTPLGNVVAVAAQLPGPLSLQVHGLAAPARDRAVLVLHDGTRVEMGRAERIAEKARALSAVLEDVGEANVSVIDVRSPSNPVVEP